MQYPVDVSFLTLCYLVLPCMLPSAKRLNLFPFSEHMLYEARAYGADTVLLICAILDQVELTSLLTKSRELGMEPLVEVANTAEMHRALDAGSKVIGVNNRNLHTFKVCMDVLCDIQPENCFHTNLSGVYVYISSHQTAVPKKYKEPLARPRHQTS
jgi:hypothetical protein